MSMHFENEKEYPTAVELRTDTQLAAQVIATREGITILIAEGFEIAPDQSGHDHQEAHIVIRERRKADHEQNT